MKANKKQESTTSDVPEEETETYPIYTNSGTINVTINGNGNVVTFMSGNPTQPPPKPGGQ